MANERAADLDAVAGSIARLIDARPHEIARFENTTAAWNAAFWSVPMAPGQRILVHDHEYGANSVAFLRAVEEYGVVIERVRSDESGQVSVAAMADALSGGDVALVSLTHVPTNGGLVNPAAEIGALARVGRRAVPVDACQSVGQLDLDVDVIGCDFLSATGRKFLRGPRGTGFLYVRESILDRVRPSQPDHHGADLVASRSVRAGARERNGSSTGSTTTRRGSASAPPSITRWVGVPIGSRRRSLCVPRSCASGLSTPVGACTTKASGSARSSRSAVAAVTDRPPRNSPLGSRSAAFIRRGPSPVRRATTSNVAICRHCCACRCITPRLSTSSIAPSTCSEAPDRPGQADRPDP